MEQWYTQKKCKCGKIITIFYTYRKIVETEIRVADDFDGYECNGHFRSGNGWPNWVYCNNCQRKHDLMKFRKVTENNP